jgi:hypothetical protein
MAVDYLKTYLGIDPNDYSSMEARIRGEEPQAQSPVMMRQPMMMPQQKSLGDIEAMQMMPRQQPAPQPAPQVDDRYQGLMDQIAALRSQIECFASSDRASSRWSRSTSYGGYEPSEVNMDDAREMSSQSHEKLTRVPKLPTMQKAWHTTWHIDPRTIQTQHRTSQLST